MIPKTQELSKQLVILYLFCALCVLNNNLRKGNYDMSVDRTAADGHLLFIQHLLNALFTNQYALMRCLKHNK